VAQYPVITGASQVNDVLLNSMMDTYVLKPADLTRTSNVTPTNDSDLVFTALANAVYRVRVEGVFGALQAAGIRTRWAVPAGTTGNRRVFGPATGATANANGDVSDFRHGLFPYATDVLYSNVRNAVASLDFFVEEATVRVGATGGTVGLMWAQNVTNATGTVLSADSVLTYRQIG
jgi:hypothetical protein